MAEAQYRSKRQIREARLVIVAEMYKKGVSISKIAEEVKIRMGVAKCAKSMIFNDIQILLKEWRSVRIEDMDLAIQLELERIDDAIRELWEAWEKSKTDHTHTQSKKKGIPISAGKIVAPDGDIKERSEISTIQVEKTEKQEINFGDPRYLAEVRMQLAERRKLLGLYAAEKKEISGSMDFKNFLMLANTVEEDGQQENG